MENYDHYIAIDWALHNMALARLTKGSHQPSVIEVASDVKEVKFYLSRLKGRKILCIEESTPSQWLYTELREHVDDMIVCDPCRNRLLSEGPKTDKIDAIKLVKLLKAGLLKPVFHTTDDSIIRLRKIIRGYENTVKFGVRFKNQRSALLRSAGLDREDDHRNLIEENFVIEGIDQGIDYYEKEKLRYERKFLKLRKELPQLRHLETIPGIGLIGAVKVLAAVVDPSRFPDKSHWLSYCGLVKHDRISGGRSYGKKSPRFNRTLKSVFKTAALSVLRDNPSLYKGVMGDRSGALKRYYNQLLKKNIAEHHARHAVARRVAVLTLGVMKSGKDFDDRWREYESIKLD